MAQCLLPVALQEKKLTKEKDIKDSQLDALESAIASERQIQRAKELGLDTNMRLNPRQKGVPEPRVLKSSIYAVIGAIWLDCGKNISIIVRAVAGIFGNTEPSPWTSLFLKDLVHMDQISNNVDFEYNRHSSGSVLTCSDEINEFDDTPVPIIDTLIVHPTSQIGLNLPFTPDFRASETRVHQEINDDLGHPVGHTGLQVSVDNSLKERPKFGLGSY
ncbi:hypothetical protein B0O99DRAFT_695332 [Bisporella sp. PMI_857]|nr:hypothetical protein B0O99DRAFT_695332 [Bisporella sp. PMI_857]